MQSNDQSSSPAATKLPEQSDNLNVHNTSAPPSHMHAADAPSNSDFYNRLAILSTNVPNVWIAPFCGGAAGVASGIVTCPLDVIKTKLQAQGGFARRNGTMETKTLYRGMLGTGRVILREDGIRGLYQGLGPMLMGYLPTWAVYLAIYDRTREYFYEQTGKWSCISLHGMFMFPYTNS